MDLIGGGVHRVEGHVDAQVPPELLRDDFPLGDGKARLADVGPDGKPVGVTRFGKQRLGFGYVGALGVPVARHIA